jgi:hypothetical protein
MLQAIVLLARRPRPAASCRSRRRGAVSAITLAWVLAATLGQAADYASLSQVESATETRDYSQQVRDKKFAEAEQAYLTGILLPQLAKEANRPAIGRTRQRIRELAVRDAAPETFARINAVLRDEMSRLSKDADAEPVLRINAVLLIGELVGPDGKPWPDAAAGLAAVAADKAAPAALRIAAVTGLARHLAAAEGTAAPAAAAAAPVVVDLIRTRPEGDPVAADWLVARAIEMTAAVPPSPDLAAGLAAILTNETASVDLRVRAAAALGKLSSPDAGIDAAGLIGQIRSLAIAAIKADLAAAEDRRFARKLGSPESMAGGMAGEGGFGLAPPPRGLAESGGGMFGGQFGGQFGGGEFGGPEAGLEPVDEDAVPTLACRRDAWRLFLLAEAIRPARSGPGLAGLLEGDAATAAADLATALRTAALDLDAKPDEATLTTSLAALEATAAGGKTAPATGRPADGAEPPAGGQTPPASPFDQPAPSPF